MRQFRAAGSGLIIIASALASALLTGFTLLGVDALTDSPSDILLATGLCSEAPAITNERAALALDSAFKACIPLQETPREEFAVQLERALEASGTFTLGRIVVGPIQGATLFLFFLGLIYGGYLWWQVTRQRRLELGALLAAVENQRITDDLAKRLAEDIEKSGDCGCDPWGVRDLALKSLMVGAQTGRVADVASEIRARIADLELHLSGRHAVIRYSNWAIPSVGFLGTVWGIGMSLGGAYKVMSASGSDEQVSAVQALTGELSVAFDTTLVALVLSLMLVAWERWLARREQQEIDRTLGQLIACLQTAKDQWALVEIDERVRDEIANRVREAIREYFPGLGPKGG